jgi:hypothetical protein
MLRLRVPLEDLETLGALLRRLAVELVEHEATISARAGLINPAVLQAARLETHLEQLRAQTRWLSETAESLGRDARLVVAAFADTDRQAAASLPYPPRPGFALPPTVPARRPWPFAAPPGVTMVRQPGAGRQSATAGRPSQNGTSAAPAADNPYL